MGVCVLYVLIWHLMGPAECRAARLKSQSAKLTARYRIGAVIYSLPGASLRSGARFDLLSANARRLAPLSDALGDVNIDWFRPNLPLATGSFCPHRNVLLSR